MVSVILVSIVQMNTEIYKQPLVLFLGAGASVPLGKKTTAQFLKWLPSQRGIDYGVLTSIQNQIILDRNLDDEKLDIEIVLDHIGKLIDAGRQFEKSGDAEILRGLEKDLENQDKGVPVHRFDSITRLKEHVQLHDQIKDLVFEHYSEVDENAAIGLYSPLLSQLADHGPLIVFTTNYDLAMEKLHESGLIELIDGFPREKYLKPRWSKEAYDTYQAKDQTGDIVLFKLHGSVDWVPTPSNGIQRIDIPKRQLGGVERVIAYPSQLKVEIHEEPYRTNYDYLLACLLYAKVCAVIGFSFRDQEIIEEFRQGLELNEDLELIIVDPKAEEIFEYLENKVGYQIRRAATMYLSGERLQHKAMAIKFTPETSKSVADEIAARLSQQDANR